MLKTFALAVAAVTFAACKTDDAPKPAAPQPTESPSNAKPRSGKIDLPPAPARPSTPPPALPSEDPRNDGEPASEQSRAERRQQRMAMIDTDGDGVVSAAEREAWRAQREAALQARLDVNQDGIVTEQERADLRRQRATNMHTRFDRDGDGKVTPQELEQAPFARFDATADANGDGQISVEELDAAMKERRAQRAFRRGQRGDGSGAPVQ